MMEAAVRQLQRWSDFFLVQKGGRIGQSSSTNAQIRTKKWALA